MAYNNRLCVGVPRCFVKYIFRSSPGEPFLFLLKLCHLIFVVEYVDCQTNRSLLSGKIVKKVIESNSIKLVDLISRWQHHILTTAIYYILQVDFHIEQITSTTPVFLQMKCKTNSTEIHIRAEMQFFFTSKIFSRFLSEKAVLKLLFHWHYISLKLL